MTRLLVLRPQPGADATVRRAKALRLDAVATPLFQLLPIDWDTPDPTGFDAILLTSANAVRMAGDGLSLYLGLPVYAVGDATARAAEEAGFQEIVAGEADGASIVRNAVESGKCRLLHLAGRDHIDLPVHGTSIERRIVYASEAVGALPDLTAKSMHNGGCVLLHSVRAAQLFAALTDAAGLDRNRVMLACLSPAICAAAGAGWERAVAAPAPTDEALLAIAARLCDQGPENGHRPRAEDRA
jgi:uroporphyrinogen-III synthase